MTPKHQVPRLLYHNLSATLHPSHTSDSVHTIRFSTPVRISSIRITPEGVDTLSGIGCTYPSKFTAKVLFNVSPSNPVNALSGTTIDYDNKGWDQDYEIGMSEGVSTRMMVIVGKIDRLSLSVYGCAAREAGATDPPMAEHEEKGIMEIIGKEDWNWVSDWAGGVPNLIQMLMGQVSPNKKEKAMKCLELLAELDPTVNDQVIERPEAISYLQAQKSPHRPLLENLYNDPKYAFHPHLHDLLPDGHRYKALVEGSDASRRDAAWRLIPDEGAFVVLKELGLGEWMLRVDYSGSSRLFRLLETLEEWKGTDQGFEYGLDLLLNGTGQEWSPTLARRVSPLLVRSRILGSNHDLEIPLAYSREVVTALIDMPPIIAGKNTTSITASFARPYLETLHSTDPLRKAFQPSPPPSLPKVTSSDRDSSRFAESLQSPGNGYSHSLTPSQLLNVLAPELLHSLTTARQPPFGLSPTIRSDGSQLSASASAFAGKVYSSHDFRTRQLLGDQVSGVTAGNTGLGISGNRGESRPASRHVDDYVR